MNTAGLTYATPEWLTQGLETVRFEDLSLLSRSPKQSRTIWRTQCAIIDVGRTVRRLV